LTTDLKQRESRQGADRVSPLTAKASSTAAVVRRHQQLARDAQAADPTIRDDYDPLELATIWEQLEFSSDEVDRWLRARCYSPLVAKDLRIRGVPPEEAAAVTAAGAGDPDTIAFKLSSSRLLLSEALKELTARAPAGTHQAETGIRHQLVALNEALEALLGELRDRPADASAVACAAEVILHAAKQTAIALSYLHRRGQELGDQLPADLMAELLSTAAELDAVHESHAAKILRLVDTANHPTTTR
jgi:hypothetical protein